MKKPLSRYFRKKQRNSSVKLGRKNLRKNESLSDAQGSKIKTKTQVNGSDENNADLRTECNEWRETLKKTQARLKKELKSPNNSIRKVKGNPYKQKESSRRGRNQNVGLQVR